MARAAGSTSRRSAAARRRLLPRDDRATQRARMPRIALAHVGGETDRLASRGGIGDHAARAVENAEERRLGGGIADRRELRGRRRAQVEVGPHPMRELEQAIAGAPGAVGRIAAQEAARRERGQQAMQRGARQRRVRQQLHERRGGRGGGDEIEHVERLVENGGAVVEVGNRWPQGAGARGAGRLGAGRRGASRRGGGIVVRGLSLRALRASLSRRCMAS